MISILLLSIDRHDMITKTLPHNLQNCGFPYELLVCDNGSKDKRVIQFLESQNPKYFRKNSVNEGVGKAFNQLYLRSSGSLIALMSNDIYWPKNWGSEMVRWSKIVDDPGLMGIDWGHSGTPPLTEKKGLRAHWLDAHLNRIFGPTCFSREVVNKVGLFHEGFDVYGLEDSDLNERVNRSGLNSFYIPGLTSDHIGHDVGEATGYRKMKDDSAGRNQDILGKRIERYSITGLFEPLPPERDPL